MLKKIKAYVKGMMKEYMNPDFRLGRTAEEDYVNAVHDAVRHNEDISGAYNHETYIACMKTMSIHGKDVEEPTKSQLTVCISCGILITGLIVQFGGV